MGSVADARRGWLYMLLFLIFLLLFLTMIGYGIGFIVVTPRLINVETQLAESNVTDAVYGSLTEVPVLNINSNGLVFNASTVPATPLATASTYVTRDSNGDSAFGSLTLGGTLYCTGSGPIDSSCLTSNANSSTNIVEITSTQNWTAPSGVTRVIVHASGGGAGGGGGGGGGGGSTTTAASGGGSSHNGGSAYLVTTTFSVIPGTVYLITIGAGGTGGAGGAGGGPNSAGATGVTGTAGGQGGTTSFGSLAHFGGAFSGPGGNPGSLGAGGTSGNYLAQTNYGGLMPTGANGGTAGNSGGVPSLIVQNTNPQLMLTTDGDPPIPGVGGTSCGAGCGGGGGAARGAFGPMPTAVVGSNGGDGGATDGSNGQDGASISNFPGQGGMGGGGGGGGGATATTGSTGGRGGNGSNGGRGRMLIVY